jgi:hypothetical protein
MEMAKFFADQLEREAAASRKVLERVPKGRNDWKPVFSLAARQPGIYGLAQAPGGREPGDTKSSSM